MNIYPIQCKFNTFTNSYVRSILSFQHQMKNAILVTDLSKIRVTTYLGVFKPYILLCFIRFVVSFNDAFNPYHTNVENRVSS